MCFLALLLTSLLSLSSLVSITLAFRGQFQVKATQHCAMKSCCYSAAVAAITVN
jgi:hypothetical protein